MPEPENVIKYHIILYYTAQLTEKEEIVQVGLIRSHGPIKAENFPQLVAKEEGERQTEA